MPNQSIALVANGTLTHSATLAQHIKSHDKIIAVDGGLHHCHALHITPDMIIGDLDSVTPEMLRLYAHVPIKSFPADKDETDVEIALRFAAEPDVKRMTLFGGLGERSDHSLYNLHLLARYPQKLVIETATETLFAIENSAEIPCSPGQTISFIPIGESPSGVSTKGLKWELSNAKLSSDFMSISNICLASTIKISIAKGKIICILQK